MDDRSRWASYYERTDEAARLLRPGLGELVRLRTWDLFGRHLPPAGVVVDVGGGPGVHAAHLAALGYEVHLVDPLPHHVATASARGAAEGSAGRPAFTAMAGDARHLALTDRCADAVLLMGPLYHLVDRGDRVTALREAARVARPGGVIIAEVITRCTWIMDASLKGVLEDPEVQDEIAENLASGLSQAPERHREGTFWAYFHHVDDLRDELATADLEDHRLVAVEGFAWLLGNLEALLVEPAPLLDAIRRTEDDPSMLGASAHVLAVIQVP